MLALKRFELLEQHIEVVVGDGGTVLHIVSVVVRLDFSAQLLYLLLYIVHNQYI